MLPEISNYIARNCVDVWMCILATLAETTYITINIFHKIVGRKWHSFTV